MTTATRPAVVPPPLKRELYYGLKGEDVKYVQTILQREGFFNGTPLGNFKKLTKEAVIAFQIAHIDEFGKQLKGDGRVGDLTWWALHNPHGDAQRNFISTDKVVQIAESKDTTRHRLLAVCAAMHAKGIREIPDGSNYGDGVTPIVNACGFSYGIFWCLAAVSYAWKEATGEPPLGAMHVGCSLFWNEAVKRGIARPKGSGYRPVPGDIAIYNYGKGLNSKGQLSGAGHAAIVARVNSSGSQFNAFEGNIGNRYKFSVRNVSEGTLVGFVNLHGDFNNPPKFPVGITSAPSIVASYAETR